ncbi:hypothetical protein [Gordonia malaquae]|uniref:hypothetical protein n=1 Tax=Gordonia malaquae TaxID=410332 RepID=UPI0030FE3C15
MTRFKVPTVADSVTVIGLGGTAKIRQAYEDGRRLGDMTADNGKVIRRLSGVAMSVAGVAVDGVTIDTTSVLEEVPAGVIFKASGEVELTIRAEGRAGFGNGGPRGVLQATAYIEELTPVGTLSDVLATTKAAPTTSKAGAQ